MTVVISVILLFSLNMVNSQLNAEREWTNFKLTHSKVYESEEQEKYRYEIFRDNLRMIEEHNAKYEAGLITWYMKVNEFTDMTAEEFKTQFLSDSFPTDLSEVKVSSIEIPEKVSADMVAPFMDYKEAFGPVRNQGSYSTCYAFAATAAVEAHLYLMGYPKEYLSPQNIIDCTKGAPYFNNGSSGGFHDRAMHYMAIQGVMRERDYPYTGYENNCYYNANKVYVKLRNFIYVPNQEWPLLVALNNTGPVAINIDAKEWQCYGGGVFMPLQDFNSTNHAIVVAGYGQTSCGRQNYWVVRNSWGPTWGESGNIRVTRQIYGYKHIGIGSAPAVAVIPVI